MRIIDGIIKGNVLFAISDSRIDVRWQYVSHNNEAILCMDFVVSIVERVPLVNSMENGCLNMA